ncbi:MAG: hypothetical protein LW870_11590, partial [Pirellula sp.]|nr:hypothetical protein [Pirellula sp.]
MIIQSTNQITHQSEYALRRQKKRRLTSDTYQFSGLAYSKRKRAASRAAAEVAIDNYVQFE